MIRMLGSGGEVVVVGGRMMRMLGLGLPGGSGGAAGDWEVIALPSFLVCWRFWGRVPLLSVSLAWVRLEAVELGGRGVGRIGAWLAGPDPLTGPLPAFAWSLSRGCA